MRKSVVKSSCGLYWLWLMGSGCLCTSRISLGRLLLYFRVGNGGTALKMKLYNTTLSGKPISKSETVGKPRRQNYTTLLNRIPCQLRWGRRRRHCSAIVWHTFFHALHLETRPPIFKMIKLKKLRHALAHSFICYISLFSGCYKYHKYPKVSTKIV